MSSYAAAAAAAGGAGWRSPFTASQWQELEHQALIFKYLVAGVPVPSELLLPILKSFESMAARFYHHPTMGYCSLYGKKLDPEPWRCRRTDGKKWRCSKNAYPDSKYCERHMHRGRNRSRKPVETPSLSQSQPPTSSPSSTVTTLAPSGGAGMGAAAAAAKSLPSGIPLQSLGCSGGGSSATQVSLTGSSGLGQLQIGPGYYHMPGGDNRCVLFSTPFWYLLTICRPFLVVFGCFLHLRLHHELPRKQI
ncbi:hypothetical protein Taro_003100 [Colocasia esculenta]|uniref:Growth-regulating factor n=1 Tax=Colocasia esculenta TaxID=4460 RepID=A0A843TQU8_COLES|nr:hypothetical protein [Colocasia esculenta]